MCAQNRSIHHKISVTVLYTTPNLKIVPFLLTSDKFCGQTRLIQHCAAAFFLQVPKLCTDLDWTLFHHLILPFIFWGRLGTAYSRRPQLPTAISRDWQIADWQRLAKNRKLKFIWILYNRPANQGSKLLFPVIKANKINSKIQEYHTQK